MLIGCERSKFTTSFFAPELYLSEQVYIARKVSEAGGIVVLLADGVVLPDGGEPSYYDVVSYYYDGRENVVAPDKPKYDELIARNKECLERVKLEYKTHLRSL